jgi:hypothetical protein
MKINHSTKYFGNSNKGYDIKSTNRFSKKIRYVVATAFVAILTTVNTSCNKFLDIVPDNVATIDMAFKLRNEAEKYLFTCYSYLPLQGDLWYNAGILSGDELWFPQSDKAQWTTSFQIAQGEQNNITPLFDEWQGVRKGGITNNGGRNGYKIFAGIRHCNIFIENMKDPKNVPDMLDYEKARWIGEAEFLKAYYHYYLLRMYGPIPILDKNLGIDASIEDVAYNRMPVDQCVDFISNLLDEAILKLPSVITNENTELGRITQPIALAVKAKLLILAASPLFNGNPDYASFKDKNGVALFNAIFDAGKWEKAKVAAKEAIDASLISGHKLQTYTDNTYGLSDATKTQLGIRLSVTERWSSEHIWALSNSYFFNEGLYMPPFQRGSSSDRFIFRGTLGAPIKIAKMYYSENGVPIEEDNSLNFTEYDEIRTATADEKFNIEPGYQTARLNFDREPRFYASLGFDGGIWYQHDGNGAKNDINTFYVKSKNSESAGLGHFTNWNETGYFIKKLVHWQTSSRDLSSPVWKQYPWPEIRLADLYLMYAEAENEVNGGSTVAIEYLDKVRVRAGLKGVVESWTNYSKNPAKFTSQSGLREIIHQERLIELAFEGHRFWDLRRWKKAAEELNKPITGWNIYGKTTATYNQERLILDQKFIAPRDYLWPIGIHDLRRNTNLVENPGWQ